MTNFSDGHRAEQIAAEYLYKHGYKIIDINWKTTWCEIDIIVSKGATIYFVEVKYRRNNTQGSGIDYITSQKLTQMTRAAESWIQQNDWNNDYQLAVLELAGDTFDITAFIDIV